MLLTPHTMVGVALASSIPNPFISVPLSFFMHFLGDIVPHWDFYTNTKKEERWVGWRPLAVMADLAVGVAVGVFFTLYALWVVKNPQLSLNIFLCGIASVLPDALIGPHIFNVNGRLSFLSALAKVQSKLQTQAPVFWGIISQLVVVLISLVVLANSLIL